jgi:segregation and condensation protein A
VRYTLPQRLMEYDDRYAFIIFARQPAAMEQRIFSLVVEEHDPSWKAMIMDLVSSGKFDPWDIDVSVLTSMYLERLKTMHEANLHVSGKMLLAAALLLKMKSARLVGEDLSEFDRILAQGEMTEEEFYDELEQELRAQQPGAPPVLLPRTPQARTRKVTIFDLVGALEKALETRHRRLIKIGSPEAEIILPHKPIDIELAMKQVYKRVREWFTMNRTRQMRWSDLVGDADRNTRLYTFIPLLHLGTARKVDLDQKQNFDDFSISLPKME